MLVMFMFLILSWRCQFDYIYENGTDNIFYISQKYNIIFYQSIYDLSNPPKNVGHNIVKSLLQFPRA